MNEVWKDIPNYEGMYQVSSLGRVKSLKRKADNGRCIRTVNQKIITLLTDTRGYLTVKLHKDGVKKSFKVHQLVAMAFLNHKPDGMSRVVDHINNNKLDNKLNNLQVISQRENSSKDKKGISSKYVGVSKRKDMNKWRARMLINGVDTHLGYFDTELQAKKAYDLKLNSL